jgi:hypothetical protein
MKSAHWTFKDKFDLSSTLTFEPKIIEVILHEDPVVAWMEETFHST